MKKIKTILKSSKEIIITYILNYLIIFILCLFYTLLGYKNLDNFMNTYCLYISLIYYIIVIIYLYKKNHRKELKLPKNKCFPLLYLGISIAVLLNMIIFLINPPQPIESSLSPLLILLSSGIIGPIYEEILFRYLLYNRLKKEFNIKKSIIITTLIFAIIHLSPIKIIYAFILGLVLNLIYEKHKNIIAPILLHIGANSIVILLNEYNSYILLLSIIGIIISIKLNIVDNKNNN